MGALLLEDMSGDKTTRARVAFGLLCGLALCCSVMYITADGDALEGESVLASGFGFSRSTRTVRVSRPKVHGIGGPSSVHSTDVQKAGQIFTNTPDGRMRLTDYLANVEKEIAAEGVARKRDVANVRAQMDRNMAFNEAARRKMKAALLRRMAANARKAKHDLMRAMRYTQWRFHKAAALQNARNRANIEKSAKIRAKVAADKRHAAHALHVQVLAQQRATAAYASAINARIKKTDQAVAKNAAQIKSNAIAAQKALAAAVSKFDKKANNAKALAAKGRSKLAAQLARQGRATRQWANNRLKVVMAKTAAQFRRVRAKMQRDRHHADFALKAATSRMTASLNAAKALNDKRFAKNVKRIKNARKEAAMRVARARADFRVRIRSLRATVKQQVAKTNARITQLSGVVDKNKLAQAKVNANVRAEMGELKRLVNANKAANDRRLKAMANHYAAAMDKVRTTMKKNRAHATRMLAKKTAALYSAISKSERAQMKGNGNLAKQTRDARLDIADGLRKAKNDFAKRMANLHSNIIKNDKKFEKKLDKLTGIVRKNAMKNAKGRHDLAVLMASNKKMLQAEVQSAVHKGEQRMMKAENMLKDMNKKTKASLNMRITSKVSLYAKKAAAQINNLRMSSKAARAEMRKEMMMAVKTAAQEAKKNLAAAYKQSRKMFRAANAKEAKAAKASAAGRAKLAKSIAAQQKAAQRQLTDAVGTMSRSLSALKVETRKKIKKANKSITAYADQLIKEQKAVNALMSSQMKVLKGKIKKTRAHSLRAIGKANEKSAAGFASINRNIAKQAALEDARFQKTVKNIKAARAAATKQVRDARKSFATRIATTTSSIKDQESRLLGEIKLVGEELLSFKASQLRVNRRTTAE